MASTRTLAERAVLKKDSGFSGVSTLLLDSNRKMIDFIPWQRAMTMLWKGSVNVLSNYTEEGTDGTLREVRVSAGTQLKSGLRSSVPLPFMVSLVEFVYDPYAAYLKSDSDIALKRSILTRDEYVCAYQYRLGEVDEDGNPDGCTYKANTVDHIKPKSQGGPNTWTNLIAACKWCNNKKADRTPEEAGMKLLWQPAKYDGGTEDLQHEIWDYLRAQAGVEI
jgi:hypothetical protein